MSRTHDWHTTPEMFQPIWEGKLRAVVADATTDQGVLFIVAGDVLRLREWEPETRRYTGRVAQAEVTHVMTGHRNASESTRAVLLISIRLIACDSPRQPEA